MWNHCETERQQIIHDDVCICCYHSPSKMWYLTTFRINTIAYQEHFNISVSVYNYNIWFLIGFVITKETCCQYQTLKECLFSKSMWALSKHKSILYTHGNLSYSIVLPSSMSSYSEQTCVTHILDMAVPFQVLFRNSIQITG